jgi:hypothetical protein
MESEDTDWDFKTHIIKSACEEQDAHDKRKFKIAQILEPVKFEDQKEREMTVNSFLKSLMFLEEIETFAKWRVESDQLLSKNSKKPIPGVQ